MNRPRSQAGFTFVEILACLLVLGLGVTAAVGMVMYGVSLSARAQGRATGMATALTVTYDPTPLLPPNSTWQNSAGNASGYINNFYVMRTETSNTDPGPTLPPGFKAFIVSVDVYDAFKGRIVCSYTTRLLRQDSP
jgi:prepilin-type N-terminal cleavage/methylation domain-containing protein